MKPEEKAKKYNRFLLIVIFLFFIAFFTLYISQATGYYEYTQHKKVTFTQEQIKKFEKDVAEGKDVRVEDYLDDLDKNYQNKTSSFGYAVSQTISNVAKNTLKATFKFLNKIIEEE